MPCLIRPADPDGGIKGPWLVKAIFMLVVKIELYLGGWVASFVWTRGWSVLGCFGLPVLCVVKFEHLNRNQAELGSEHFTPWSWRCAAMSVPNVGPSMVPLTENDV